MRWLALLLLAACSQADPGPITVLTGAHLVVPSNVAAGHRYPVLVVTDDPHASGSVTIDEQRINVYRGRGAATLLAPAAGPLHLEAPGATFGATADLVVSERQTISVDADLAMAEWNDARDVLITGDVTIGTLTVDAGTRVRLAAGADLTITTSLVTTGSAAQPVLFIPEGSTWAGLHLAAGATATLAHTWFIAGGDDASQAFGHSSSQPVIALLQGGTLSLTGGGVLDSPGKAFGTVDATVTLSGTTVAHCDTGGEFSKTKVDIDHAYVLEIPDGDRNIRDDDNDGIYLQGVTPGECSITDSVFAVGEDDAIDHNGATVHLERVWVQDYSHEGLATSTGGTVTATDLVIRDCGGVGVEAGYGSPQVTVTHALITGNAVGARFGDGYDEDCTGHLTLDRCVVTGNGDDVANFVRKLGGPAADAITVTCSLVDDPQATGTMNSSADPALDGVCQAALADPACSKPAGPVTCPDGPP